MYISHIYWKMKSKLFKILWKYKCIRPLLWKWSPRLSRYLTMEEWGTKFMNGFTEGLKEGDTSKTRRTREEEKG